MPEMIEDNRQLQAIVRVTALPASLPRDRDMAVRLLEATDQSLAFWLAVEHVMELARALQRAGIRKIERAAQQQGQVTEDHELAEKVRQRTERDAEGRCCPRSVGELSPTYSQYSSRGCSS